MVRKFVFIPGAEPHIAPLHGVERAMSVRRISGGASVRHDGPGRMAMQWVLLVLALAVSAIAFSAAKAAFDRQPGQAAAER